MKPAEPRRRVKVQIMTDSLAGEGEIGFALATLRGLGNETNDVSPSPGPG